MKVSQGKHQTFFSRRSTRYGANAAVITLLIVAILVLIQLISARNPRRWDLTANKRYTLSDQTAKILSSLKKPIRVIAFYREGEIGREQLKDLLEQYAGVTKKLTHDFIDPDRNPVQANKYQITAYGTMVVESDGRLERLTDANPNEEAITNAILKTTRSEKKIIYFLQGHGEPKIEDDAKDGYGQAKQAIEKENYAVKELVLLQEEEVPKDASVVSVCGPKKELLPEELNRLHRYILGGGKVLFMLDPFTAPELAAFLKKYNLWVGEDIIIDKQTRITGSDLTTDYSAMPIVSQYEPHPITKGFREFSVFPWTRSITPHEESKGGIHARTLARTGRGSWAETNRAMLEKGTAVYDDGLDHPGPVSVAAVVTVDSKEIPDELKAELEPEKTSSSSPEGNPVKPARSEEKDQNEGSRGRLVVFGNSAFASNAYMGLLGNQDFFLNAISWLAEEQDLISIRPKTLQGSPVILTSNQARMVFWVPVVFLPVAVLLAGSLILYHRRRTG